MINDDVLIKYARSRGYKHLTWPEQVMKMKDRMTEMKLGFPGLGNDHLSLIEYKDAKPGDIIIFDPSVESGNNTFDDAPIMLKLCEGGKSIVEGIGKGVDSKDPYRRVRWKDIITTPQIPESFLVFRVDVRPDLNGGPGYYYFFKSYRDFRD